MNRLRTINEAYNFLKEQDPGTSITPYFIRRMVVNSAVPCFKVGRKYLLDVDALQEHITGKLTTEATPETPGNGLIRPISEKKKLSG